MSVYLCVSVVICGSLGCESQNNARTIEQAVNNYYDGNFPAAINELKPLAEKTNEDFVVNNLRLASAEMAPYQLDDAEAAFLRAIEVINSTGVNNGGRTLGAVLVDEKIKIWKGEPFERAMASYYLGVIYYMRHDYQNARASFENALFKLRDYNPDLTNDSKEVDSDFAPAMLMLAKSYQRIGRDDLAKANFQAVTEHFPALGALANEQLNADSNLLLIVDFGVGPRKVANNDGAVVGFRPLPREQGRIPPPLVYVDGSATNSLQFARPPVDLLALAQERRWESIDTLRAVKSAVGTGLLIGGAITGVNGLNSHGSRQRTDLMVSGALIGAGLLLKATSQADIRQWEMLPRTSFIVPLHVPPGTHEVAVEFPGGVRQVWRGLVVPEKGEATYYYRMLRWDNGPFNWPPPGLANSNSAP